MPETRFREIVRLHGEIEDETRTTVAKAIRLGELLELEKKRLGHGNFEEWVRKELPFSLATAKNYRMLYRQREAVKQLTFSGLSDLYRQLRGQRKRQPKRDPAAKRDKGKAADPPKEKLIEVGKEAAERIRFKVSRVLELDPTVMSVEGALEKGLDTLLDSLELEGVQL